MFRDVTAPSCPASCLAFATVKSEDARLDSLSDPSSFGDLDENDPRSVAQSSRRWASEMGEDLGPDLDAAMDEAMDEGDMGGRRGSVMDAGGADDAESSEHEDRGAPGSPRARRDPLERAARPVASAVGLHDLAVADRVERGVLGGPPEADPGRHRYRGRPRGSAAALRGRSGPAAYPWRGRRLRLPRPDRAGRPRGGGVGGAAPALCDPERGVGTSTASGPRRPPRRWCPRWRPRAGSRERGA